MMNTVVSFFSILRGSLAFFLMGVCGVSMASAEVDLSVICPQVSVSPSQMEIEKVSRSQIDAESRKTIFIGINESEYFGDQLFIHFLERVEFRETSQDSNIYWSQELSQFLNLEAFNLIRKKQLKGYKKNKPYRIAGNTSGSILSLVIAGMIIYTNLNNYRVQQTLKHRVATVVSGSLPAIFGGYLGNKAIQFAMEDCGQSNPDLPVLRLPTSEDPLVSFYVSRQQFSELTSVN